MVRNAERGGDPKPGDTIVEASSGNTAIALAMVAKQKGYSVRVVTPRDVASRRTPIGLRPVGMRPMAIRVSGGDGGGSNSPSRNLPVRDVLQA